MAEEWTSGDEAVFRPLYRKWQRIRKRQRLDAAGRKLPFKPRQKKRVANDEMGK